MQENLICIIYNEKLYCTCRKTYRDDALWEEIENYGADRRWFAGEEGPKLEMAGYVLRIQGLRWGPGNPQEARITLATGREDWEPDVERAYEAICHVSGMTGGETIEEATAKITGFSDIESRLGPGQTGMVELEFTEKEEKNGARDIVDPGDEYYPGYAGKAQRVKIDYDSGRVIACGWCRYDGEDTNKLTRQFEKTWILPQDHSLSLRPSAGEALKATSGRAFDGYVEGQGEHDKEPPEAIARDDDTYFDKPGELICVPRESMEKIRARLKAINIRLDGKYDPEILDAVAEFFGMCDSACTRIGMAGALREAGYRQEGEKWLAAIERIEDDRHVGRGHPSLGGRIKATGYAGKREIIHLSPALKDMEFWRFQSVEMFDGWDPKALDCFHEQGSFVFCFTSGKSIRYHDMTPRQALESLPLEEQKSIEYLVGECRSHRSVMSIWPCEGLCKPYNQAL
jgi:hypothetical protein